MLTQRQEEQQRELELHKERLRQLFFKDEDLFLFLDYLLACTKIDENTFTGNANLDAYASGQRSIGLIILNRLGISLSDYLTKQK